MMNSTRRRKIGAALVLFLLFLLAYTAHNTVYLKRNAGFYCLEQSLYDSVQHFYSAQDNPRSLPHIIWRLVGPEAGERGLYELFCWPFFFLFGVSYQTAIYPNFLFLLLLACSVYKTGVLVKNREVGYLAAFLTLMYPAVFGFSRIYFTTLAVTSLVSVCNYCFLSSGLFRSVRKTLLFVLCLLLLLKLKAEKSVIYVLFPAGLYLFSGFRRGSGKPSFSARQGVNIAAGAVLFLLLFFILFRQDFFSGRIGYYLNDIKNFSSSLRIGSASFVITVATAYLKDLFSTQLGNLGGLFFIAAFPYFLKSGVRFKSFLVFWITIPYIFHTVYYWFSGIHSAYYTVQYLPAFALISACGMHNMFSRRRETVKIAVYAVIIALSLSNYTLISHCNRQLPLLRKIASDSFTGKMSMSLIPGENIIFGTAQKLAEAVASTGGSARVVLANHYPSLHWLYGKMRLHNSIMRYPVFLYDYSYKVFSLEPPDKRALLSQRFKNADLIIDGKNMYPVESSGRLGLYRQFGAYYDFRGVMKNEEEEYKGRIADMEKIYSVNTGENKIDFWISREARQAFIAKTGRDICAFSRQEISSLIRRPLDKGKIMNQRIKFVSSGGRNTVFWKDRELLSFTALEDYNTPGFISPNFCVETKKGELIVSKTDECGNDEGGHIEQVWTIRLVGDMLDLKLEIDTRDQLCLRLQRPLVCFLRRADGPAWGCGVNSRKISYSRDIVFGGLKQRFFEYESAANGPSLSLNKKMSFCIPSFFIAPLLGRHYDTHELSLLLHGIERLYGQKFPARRILTGGPGLRGSMYVGIAPDADLPGMIMIYDSGLLTSLYRADEYRIEPGNIGILAHAGGTVTLGPGRFTVLSCRIIFYGTAEDFFLAADKLRQDTRPGDRPIKIRLLRQDTVDKR
ncbi:MAG: hypothetical protein GX598_00625 [Elusimicrobia bacterium]|nr:hypothetical protein [Elusimicrobiota bacterium]